MKTAGVSKVVALALLLIFSFSMKILAQTERKPLEIKVATWIPPQIAPGETVRMWAKEIEERSGGEIKFIFFWSGSLVKMEDTFRATLAGLADVGMWVIGSSVGGLVPLNEYISLPFLGFKNTPILLEVFREMRKRFPELDAEFSGMRYLYGWPMPPYQFHFTSRVKKKVRLPQDLKGIKIMCDAMSSHMLNYLGAVAVSKGPQDWYLSLQKGLVDAHLVHWATLHQYKLEELFAYHTEVGAAGVNSLMSIWLMNENTWNKLSHKTQKIIMELQPKYEERSLRVSLELQEIGREAARKAGHEIIELSPGEVGEWVKATEPLKQEWVDKMEAKGLPGRIIYQEARKLIQQFNKE